MSLLTPRDRELVALAAALAANCIPCVEYHIPEARKAGLSDAEIREAIELAERIRRVPAAKVLDVASNLLSATLEEVTGLPAASACSPGMTGPGGKSCC